MKTLNLKLARELYRSKGLLLAVTSIIALGVMCFVTMRSAYQNLSQAKRRYYAQCRMADFWIDVKKVPLAELDALARLPGITEIRPRIQFVATVDLENEVEAINSVVISLPDRPASVVNDIVLRQGGYFTDRRENEVIVNDAFARAHKLYPGSWIHILLNNRRQELFIVGTAVSSEFTYLLGPGSIVPDNRRFGVFYVKQTFAEEVFDFEGAVNQVVGRLSPEVRQHSDDVLRRAENLLEPYGVFNVTPAKLQASNQFLSNEIDGLGSFAAVLPTIFLAVAALVLNVLITRLARQQRVVVGTLKALGYTDGQIFFHFLQFGLCVGIVGGVLGCVLGYVASIGMTAVYRFFFQFPDLRSGVYWPTHAAGLAVSLVCSVSGSVYGAVSMLLLQPAEAMRPEPPRRGGAIWLDRFPRLWNQFNSAWRMSMRSLFRNRLRTIASLFASCMGAGLLVTGFMMVQSQRYFLEFQFRRLSQSDIDLAFKDERGPEALDEVRSLPGVDQVEPVLDVACTFVHGPYHRKGGVTGLSSEARLTKPRDARGEPIALPNSGLIMTRALAKILHAEPGDRVTLLPVKGERRPVEVTIAKISDSYLGLAAYAEIHFLSRAIGEDYALSGVQVATDGNVRHVAELHRELKQTPGVQAINLRREMVQNISDTLLRNQMVFIGFLVVFAGTIFFGSIVNASLVNLAERQREAATFRALGYGEWQIGLLFLRETLITTLVGAVLGLPCGYFLTWLATEAYNNELIRIPLVGAPWIWALTLSLALLFALAAHAAHAVVQWNLHRLDYVESLKVRE